MLRRTLVSGLAATALLTTPAATGVASAGPPRTDDGTGRALRVLLDAEHAAGMPGVFAEVRDGRRTWTPTAGLADVTTGRPVRDGERHRVGSITKSFTATTVLQLVGERRIALDAPIGRYLPDVVPGATGRQVSVRMLLQHTSGIGDYDTVLITDYPDLITLGSTTYTPRQLVAIGLGAPPTNAPGAAWSYSNTNYILLGMLIEKVTGHRYSTEISRRILRPLGLRDTYFPGAETRIRGPHMAAYVPWPDGSLRDFSVYNMTWGWAAGELVSTADDLNRFYRALFTGRLLRPDLFAQMRTTVPMEPEAPELGGYGLGIYSVALPCGLFWGHDGGTVGHVTISWHSADGTRQVTMGENMAFFDLPDVDTARFAFLATALCGPRRGGTRATAPPLPRTPDLHRPTGITAR